MTTRRAMSTSASALGTERKSCTSGAGTAYTFVAPYSPSCATTASSGGAEDDRGRLTETRALR